MDRSRNEDKLLLAMDQQAARDREAILRDAQTLVREIEAQNQAAIERVQARIRIEADRTLRLERERLEGQSLVEFRRARQDIQTRLLQQVFRQARRELTALSKSPQYRDILAGLIAEALALTGPDAHVEVAAAEEKLCRDVIKQQALACSLQAAQVEPGTVRVVAADGARRVDNSLQTRLDRVESLCRHEVAALLFQETAQDGKTA